MFTRLFFRPEGLARFKDNFSRNLCHVAVNSESVCWATLSAALIGKEDTALDYMLLSGVENLYAKTADFNATISLTGPVAAEFTGLRDIFFTYYVRRLPLIFRGTSLSWSRPKTPTKEEIVAISEHCIQSYAQQFQATASDFILRWREDSRRGFRWTRWWIPSSTRDAHYYDLEIVESFLQDSLEAMLELRYPEFLRLKSQKMQGEHADQVAKWRCYHAWLRRNRHVFMDKLADHLQLAYPIYSAWSGRG